MENQISLHPFDQLLEIDSRSRFRSTTEAECPAALRGRLALRLGAWNLMFALEEVAEIIPLPRITRVTGVKTWLLGMANLRGVVISVVDLREFLTGKPTMLGPNSRVVVVRSGEWHYGLLVDEIIGMRQFGQEDKLPALDMIDAGLRPYLTEAFQGENKKWLAFSASRLLNDARFLGAAH